MEKATSSLRSDDEIQFLPKLKSPFRFNCVACGQCCGSFAIVLSPYDVFRLRKGTGLTTCELINGGFITVRHEFFREVFSFAPIADFLKAFGLVQNDTVPVAFLQLKKIGADKEECFFLEESGNGKRLCRIYQNRPTMCRLHPLGYITINGRRRWFFRKPKCKTNGGGEKTVKDWISLSHAQPYLSANARFLSWMKEFLNATHSFDSLSEERKQMAERILYNFDSLTENGERLAWRNIIRRFEQWQSDLQET